MTNSLWDCYWAAWRKTFVYQGSASRRDFWSFIIINLFILFFIGVGSYFLLIGGIADNNSAVGMMLVWVFYICLPLSTLGPFILLFPVIALGIRRMHDIGKSGWCFGGLLLMELVVLPILSTLVDYTLGLYLAEKQSQQIVGYINSGFIIIVTAALIWICCKPTKTTDLPLSSDVVD